MKWTTLDRFENSHTAWYESGNGRPLVFLHGVGLRAEAWQAQLEYFSDDYKVFAWDMPGHGRSPRLEEGAATLRDYCDRLMAFLRDVVQEPAVLIGHSMGAMIALDCAARNPAACVGVAALNGIFKRDLAAQQAVQERACQLRNARSAEQAQTPVIRWFGHRPEGDLRLAAVQCARWLQQADARGYAAAYQVFADYDGPTDDDLRDLVVPSLFLTGVDDNNSTPAMSHNMAELAGNSRSEVIDNAGHMLPMTHVQEVNRSLKRLAKQAFQEAQDLHHAI